MNIPYFLSFLFVLSFINFSNAQIQIGSTIVGEAGDFSGSAVAVSANGQRVAILATGADGINGSFTGAVRIYEWQAGDWAQIGENIIALAASDYSSLAPSCIALSDDGARVAIGAPHNDGLGYSTGNVRMFEFIGGAWGQMGQTIYGVESMNTCGEAVAFSSDGNRVVIGASGNDNNFGGNSGHIRIFEWQNNEWILLGQEIIAEASNDEFGTSVTISSDGNRVAAGAHYHDIENGSDGQYGFGHVRVFEFQDENWVQMGQDIFGAVPDEHLGRSVSMSSNGNRIAIGANGLTYDDIGGIVRIYEWQNDEWIQMGLDIEGPTYENGFGQSLSISGDGTRVLIGSPHSSNLDEYFSGNVSIYKWENNSWIQIGQTIDGVDDDDFCGSSVSISEAGNMMALGSKFNDDNGNMAGHVRIYSVLVISSNYPTCIGEENGAIDVVSWGFTNSKWSYQILDETDVVVHAASFDEDDFFIDNLASGNYEFQVLNETGGLIYFEAFEIVGLPTSFAQEEIVVCEEEALEVFGNTITESGIYEQTFTNEYGCDSTHQIQVYFNALDFELPETIAVPSHLDHQLPLSISNQNVDVFWESTVPLDCYSCPNPSYNITQQEFFTVTLTDEYGCTEQASILVSIDNSKCQVFIPNIFTPNDDGKNDVFSIGINPNCPLSIHQIEIYSRWGGLYYSAQNISEAQGWDGTFEGKAVQSGVYIYVLSLQYPDGRIETKIGDLVLYR